MEERPRRAWPHLFVGGAVSFTGEPSLANLLFILAASRYWWTTRLPRPTYEDQRPLSSLVRLVMGVGYYLATDVVHVLAR